MLPNVFVSRVRVPNCLVRGSLLEARNADRERDVTAIVFGCAQSRETEHEANSAQCCATHPWPSTCELHNHGNCRAEFTQGKQADPPARVVCNPPLYVCKLLYLLTIGTSAGYHTAMSNHTYRCPKSHGRTPKLIDSGRGRLTSPQYSSNLPTVQVRTSDSYKDESVKL